MKTWHWFWQQIGNDTNWQQLKQFSKFDDDVMLVMPHYFDKKLSCSSNNNGSLNPSHFCQKFTPMLNFGVTIPTLCSNVTLANSTIWECLKKGKLGDCCYLVPICQLYMIGIFLKIITKCKIIAILILAVKKVSLHRKGFCKKYGSPYTDCD